MVTRYGTHSHSYARSPHEETDFSRVSVRCPIVVGEHHQCRARVVAYRQLQAEIQIQRATERTQDMFRGDEVCFGGCFQRLRLTVRGESGVRLARSEELALANHSLQDSVLFGCRFVWHLVLFVACHKNNLHHDFPSSWFERMRYSSLTTCVVNGKSNRFLFTLQCHTHVTRPSQCAVHLNVF